MDYKEVISKLKDYFLCQDHTDVCYLLAATLVDVNRLMNQDKLDEKEKLGLLVRMQLNNASLLDFISNGSKGDLKIRKFNSDEL